MIQRALSRLKHLTALRPTWLFLSVIAALGTIGVALGLARIFTSNALNQILVHAQQLWWFSLAGLAMYCGYDWFISYRAFGNNKSDQLKSHRDLPTSFALNKPQQIRFEIINRVEFPLEVSFADAVPLHFESTAFPMTQIIDSHQKGVFEYTVTPKKRGLADFQAAYVLIKSRFGFWQFIRRLGGKGDAKVYPDFSTISNSMLFGAEQAMRNMGAHIAKRKGDGMEFNQLREFRIGDTLKQIDWKATARLGEPISREYQEEKDQNVVFLLDCSRRMRAMENNLSYFDYALNALLMNSYIALDKGDAVGVMTFSGQPSWLPPIKGKSAVNTILNHLYDLNTSTQSSDYVTAAEALLLKHRKRSLVILITNVRDEDKEDLKKAAKLLREQHLVMVVALQERLLESVNQMEVDSHHDALLYAGTKHFEINRREMLSLLKNYGLSVVDATHKTMHIQLVTEYLRLKQSGVW